MARLLTAAEAAAELQRQYEARREARAKKLADLRLLHYSAKPFALDRARKYTPSMLSLAKPDGLWVSVAGDDGWEAYCRESEFRLEELAHVGKISLTRHANLLWIETPRELDEFHGRFSGERQTTGGRIAGLWQNGTMTIDWPTVQKLWDGILIAPYQHVRRLELSWYYGWDCASGCIWNLDAIADCASEVSR